VFEGRMGDGEVEVVDGEDEAAEEEAADVIQPLQLQAITRKCRSHTDINNAKSRRVSSVFFSDEPLHIHH